MKVKIFKNNSLIADRCHVAVSFGERLMGLIGKSTLEEGEGLWIPKCNSIHMWFMRVSIDVIFIKPKEKTWIVSSFYSNVQPWKFFPLSDFNAADTLELPQGTNQKWNIQVGDELCLN